MGFFPAVCSFLSPSCNRSGGNCNASLEAFESFFRVFKLIFWFSLSPLNDRKRHERLKPVLTIWDRFPALTLLEFVKNFQLRSTEMQQSGNVDLMISYNVHCTASKLRRWVMKTSSHIINPVCCSSSANWKFAVMLHLFSECRNWNFWSRMSCAASVK